MGQERRRSAPVSSRRPTVTDKFSSHAVFNNIGSGELSTTSGTFRRTVRAEDTAKLSTSEKRWRARADEKPAGAGGIP